MNREILFRGKRCKDQEWVYGYLVESHRSWAGFKPHKSWIVDSPMTNGGWFALIGKAAVIDDTVGQYTGLKDKNGKMIFEGDVLAVTIFDYNGCDTQYEVKVVWSVAGFDCINIKNDDNVWDLWWVHRLDDEIEVVGDIYDNPELLKGE